MARQADWFGIGMESWLLGLEATQVMWLRGWLIALGGAEGEREARRNRATKLTAVGGSALGATVLFAPAADGYEVGRDLLSNMGWTFETMIAYAARDSRIVAGDVFGSGTVGNGGCLAELWGRHGHDAHPPLQPGDVVTVTVEQLGTLTTRIIHGSEPIPIPPARRDR